MNEELEPKAGELETEDSIMEFINEINRRLDDER